MHSNQTSPVASPAQSAPGSPICLPELLAPAGDWECARAAVENGADAIYFGLEKFNARMRANNFTEADLPRLMEFLHRRGVKGYVTFNILVFENEMADAEQYVRSMIAAGVDAAIVQDVGMCRLIRQHSPDFPIHVSTQMTITSAAGVEFARDLGCDLVVLARECSLKEIEKIQSSQHDHYQLSTNNHPLPLEVFIHGALCVAYSGQCLTSEALGGRSANRGECAQACRMPYDLVADGKLVPLGDRKYLLSPQDLAGLEVLPELARLGVASLKIEGRLKSPEYVANITRIYRKALDQLGNAQPEAGTDIHCTLTASGGRDQRARGSPSPPWEERVRERRPGISHDRYDMEMAFSRGLYTGWFHGTNNQQLVHGRFGKKRGVFLGEVSRIEGERVSVNLQAPLKPGDGVVFDAGHPEQEEQGGRVYEVKVGQASRLSPINPARPQAKNRTGETPVLLSFGREDINFNRIHVGDKLWKTSDPELDRRLRQSYEGDTPRFQRPILMEVHGLAGKPLTLIVRDQLGHVVQLDSTMPLARAEKHPLTTDRLREQLGRLGGTPFKRSELTNSLIGDVLLPVSELNRLRREAVRQLEAQRALPKRWRLVSSELGAGIGADQEIHASASPSPPLEERVGERRPVNILDAAVRGEIPAGCRTDMSRGRPENDDLLSLALSSKGGEGISSTPSEHRDACGEQVQAAEPERVGATVAASIPHSALRTPHLIVLVRNLAQLDAALQCGVETLYCEFEDPKKYREGVTRFRNSTFRTPHSECFVAPPRVFKMGEEWTLKQVRSSEADGYLVRNYDHLAFFAKERCIGDYSLNVANRLTADYFKNKFGLERVTASYDLNFVQLESLLQAAPPEWFEVTIHQHIPMFHMEHCVFCAFLSTGTDYTNCGRPCDKHDLKLRDRVGAEHPVKADAGCRNTVFNALAQTGADYVSRMLALGVCHFRIEFLNETPDQAAQTITRYRQLLRGEITGPQLWRELKLLNQLGVTRGQIGVPARGQG
jgi:putative protease